MNKMDIFNEINVLSTNEKNQTLKNLFNEFLSFTHQIVHDNILGKPEVQTELLSLFNSFKNVDRNNNQSIFEVQNQTHLFCEIYKDFETIHINQ